MKLTKSYLRSLIKECLINEQKEYTLIVGNTFSISNDTDSHIQSDYFPGIWAIKTAKAALQYAKEIIQRGDILKVTDYDNPQYHALANKFIKELKLKQPLFKEPNKLQPSRVTNGKPSNLAMLKKYLTVGKRIKVENVEFPDRSRETFVKKIQSNSVVLDKNGGNSWLAFNKSTDWLFTNDYALVHFIDREGNVKPSIKLIYLD